MSDRYTALGIPYPDPATMCQGQCEGIGVVPLFNERGLKGNQRAAYVVSFCSPSEPLTDDEQTAWNAAHLQEAHDCDGWHFVKCQECNGTGKRTR